MYLEKLSEKGLIRLVRETDGHTALEITPSGHRYLDEYERVKKVLRSFGLE